MSSVKGISDDVAEFPQDGSSEHEMEEIFEPGVVKNKWKGTAADKRDMFTLGRAQVLRRNFRFLSMVGFGSTLLCTWEIMLAEIVFVLTNGGTAGLFWGYIVCSLGVGLVYASLAEMASMAPTAGGQYHWVSEFAPRKYQKFLSYIVGWLCATGWQAGLVSVAFLVGTIIQGLLVLNYPDYVFERWHGTLLVIAVTAFSIIFNTLLATRLPMVEGVVLLIHMVGLFATIIPLWVLAPRANAHDALLVYVNSGGWSSTGLSAMIGLITPLSSLLGFDCAVHMAEEIHDASDTLPKAIMWSVYLNSFMGFIMAVTICFTLGDVASILGSDTGYPFIQVFYNTTKSYAVTNVLTAIIIITITSSCISEVATSSRQIWSFARDKGLPFSDFLSYVSPGMNIPIRSVMVSFIITVILACINIGSTTALNAIVSLCIVALLTSYFITIACLVSKRLSGEPLPPRRWSLGRYGMFINVGALVFLFPIWFFAFWPGITPFSATTFNWAPVIYGAIVLLAMGYYFIKGRHVYTGPVALTRRDN